MKTDQRKKCVVISREYLKLRNQMHSMYSMVYLLYIVACVTDRPRTHRASRTKNFLSKDPSRPAARVALVKLGPLQEISQRNEYKFCP
jgi:hypothetical protein